MDRTNMGTIQIPLARLPLTDYEKELVRFCAKHYQEKGEFLSYTEFPHYKDFGKAKAVEIHIRLDRFGITRGGDSDSMKISPDVLELVEQWDNPPIPDYRNRVTKWFWSQPWSIVVYVLTVGFPALVGWVMMGKTLLGWLGVK
jgi:hypothetical protein